MADTQMTSLERVLTTIGHKEPDRVPLFMLLSIYGAKELQIPIKEYFSSAENVVKAQLLMRKKYQNDCVYTFFYAPIEIEAWGGEVIFVDDGPPNSGEPVIKSMNQIGTLEVSKIEETPSLLRVLEATEQLKSEVGTTTPIIGVVMSPFSLPVMQLGFEKYLELLYFHPDQYQKLMKINEEFCVTWANAQIKAGATAICYFNPLASPTIIDRERYLSTGYPIDSRTLSRINGPTATHLASGITLPIVDKIIQTGSAVLGFSSLDKLEALKRATQHKICLLGNLNAVEMINWNHHQTEERVKQIIAKAGLGGGLIIADNHGEIPWQVPEEVLLAITETVQRWGKYPLEWVDNYEKT